MISKILRSKFINIYMEFMKEIIKQKNKIIIPKQGNINKIKSKEKVLKANILEGRFSVTYKLCTV